KFYRTSESGETLAAALLAECRDRKQPAGNGTRHQERPVMTLTDRYVAATLRSIPANSREDIERELRASIGDAIDAKVEAGSEPEAAEAAVLTDLGDPDRLAAGLTDRPLSLIGPELFLTWWRLLRVLL